MLKTADLGAVAAAAGRLPRGADVVVTGSRAAGGSGPHLRAVGDAEVPPGEAEIPAGTPPS
jgi:hypothetical protein